MKKFQNSTRGFTLIEMLVSIAIFTIVMVIALGSLLAMSQSDRKAQSLKSALNNLNFAIDDMSRALRTGINYHCDISSGIITTPQDCAAVGSNSITFLASNNVQTCYRLNSNRIEVSTDGTCSTWSALTSPEVAIKDFSGNSPASYLFNVKGSTIADTIQPKVVILLSGDVATGKVTTTLHLQTSVTQRLYDQ